MALARSFVAVSFFVDRCLMFEFGFNFGWMICFLGPLVWLLQIKTGFPVFGIDSSDRDAANAVVIVAGNHNLFGHAFRLAESCSDFVCNFLFVCFVLLGFLSLCSQDSLCFG